MPQIYAIEVSDEAKSDLIAIEDFIFTNPPQNATSVADELQRAIDSLDLFPHRCKVFEPNSEPLKNVRSMPVPPFVIFYRIIESSKTVEVLHVRHGARDRPPRFFR